MKLALAIILPAVCVVPTVDPGALAAVKLVTLAVIASWIAYSRGAFTALDAALGGFAASAILSMLIAGSPGLTVVCAICMMLVVRGGPVRWDVVELGVACAAALVAGLAICELLGLHVPWAAARRPVSTLGNRNHVASYLLLALPALVAARRRWMLAVIVLAVTVIVATRCRSAYLAGGVVGTIAFARDRARGPIIAIAIGICLGAMPWPGVRFAPSVADSAGRVFAYDSGSGLARIHQHEVGLAALAAQPSHWLTGFGAGSWETVAAERAHREGHTLEYTGALVPSSDLLRIATEQGLLGLAAIGLAFVLAFRSTRRFATRITLVAAAICAAFDPIILRPECIALLGVVIGADRASGSTRAWLAPVCALAIVGAAVKLFDHSDGEGRTLVLAHAGRCREAERALDPFITRHPLHWGARVSVARCFEREGSRTEALRIWTAAFAIEPHLRALVITHRKGPES
ncbi:MAG TPA: hypothetical protein VGC41_01330 [Kofleriaceae bacterium]